MRKTVFIGIGTNKGNREKNVSAALKLLSKHRQIKIIKISKMLENPPQEGIKSGYFLNGALKLVTTLSPKELYKICKGTEQSLGRIKTKDKKKKSRTIDLDILFYGKEVINTKELIVPHPKLHLRSFVLIPLKEVAGNFVHPVLKKTTKELHHKLNSNNHQKLRKSCIKV